MLQNLHITNLALIETLNVQFNPGLSIITGETGAGKSIILGAIDLLRGRRADTRMLRNKDLKAYVEAEFDISDLPGVQHWLRQQDLDTLPDERLTLRREISPNGRSRAFINDSPATLQAMSQATTMLLDIHSQHQTQALANPRTRLAIIDAMSPDAPQLLQEYKQAFAVYLDTRNKLKKLREKIERDAKRRAELQEKKTELDDLAPKQGEQRQLEEQYEIQSRATEIKNIITGASVAMQPDIPGSASYQIERALTELQSIDLPIFENQKPTLTERLHTLLIEARDIAEELKAADSKINDDPEELMRVENRLNRLYEAQLRYKAIDADELARIHIEIRTQLAADDDTQQQRHQLEAKLKQDATALKEVSSRLSDARIAAAAEFSTKLQSIAMTLGLPNLQFQAKVSPVKMWSEGADIADFLCAFNRGQQLMPLEDTASGGEASRLMLAMKAIVAGKLALPTLIFDEIDTGISGPIAALAGKMMADISQRIQVIAITHLPQVAASGKNHYKVFKTDTDTDTVTSMILLDDKKRRIEIARMLAGCELDEAAMHNADSLLQQHKTDNMQ